MTLRLSTVQRSSNLFILLSPITSLRETLLELTETGSDANRTYLMIESRNRSNYRIALEPWLCQFVAVVGYESFKMHLRDIPLVSVMRVIQMNTIEPWSDIKDWAVTTSNSSTVFVDSGGSVCGLLVNPNRSIGDVFAGFALSGLYGNLVDLVNEPRARFESHVAPPTCPICHSHNFYVYAPSKRGYYCPTCKSRLKLK